MSFEKFTGGSQTVQNALQDDSEDDAKGNTTTEVEVASEAIKCGDASKVEWQEENGKWEFKTVE